MKRREYSQEKEATFSFRYTGAQSDKDTLTETLKKKRKNKQQPSSFGSKSYRFLLLLFDAVNFGDIIDMKRADSRFVLGYCGFFYQPFHPHSRYMSTDLHIGQKLGTSRFVHITRARDPLN